MFLIVLNTLKFLIFLLRLPIFKTSGTSLAGFILEKFFPRYILKLFSQLKYVIFITGTNGKTTTAKSIIHILKQNNFQYIHNPSGSNMLRGILTVLIDHSSFLGILKSDIGVFEIEEGSFPKISEFIKPNLVVVTNIFRDQLDAYGEIDKTYEYIKRGILNSNNPILVLNGNDLRVKRLKYFTNNKVYKINLDKEFLNVFFFENDNVNDLTDKIKLDSNTKNDDEIYVIKNYQIIKQNDQLISTFDLVSESKSFLNIKSFLLGLHNSYNLALSIITCNSIFNIDHFDFLSLEPAFGRGEVITVKQKNNKIKKFNFLLSKNPAGFNLNLSLLSNFNEIDAILLVLNNRIADSKDVSWIWDVNFSLIKNIKFKHLLISGDRVWDMVLRLKYEDIDLKENLFFEDLNQAINFLLKSDLKNVYILPTYTAMLEARKILKKFAYVKNIWK